MALDVIWRCFRADIALIGLSLGCLVMDILLPDDEKRGKTLASVAMIGVALIFFHLCSQWGRFGSALGGTLVQDGVSFYFKLLFLLAAFFTLFMAREYQSKLKRGHEEFIL